MAVQDFDSGSLYGLEKFWAFHHYMGLPKGCGLQINKKVHSQPRTSEGHWFFRPRGNPRALHHSQAEEIITCSALQLRTLLEEQYRTLDDFPRSADKVCHLRLTKPHALRSIKVHCTSSSSQ